MADVALEDLAKGLTAGERTGLNFAHHEKPVPYGSLQRRVRVAMFKKGLLQLAMTGDDGEPFFCLTPLGLDLSTYLEGHRS